MRGKLKMIIEWEYEIDPKHYPGKHTAKEMVDFDATTYQNDPSQIEYVLFDENGFQNKDVKITVDGDVIYG